MDVNIVLSPDFETLVAFEPVEIFDRIDDYHLRFVSIDGIAVKSKQRLRWDMVMRMQNSDREKRWRKL